MIRERVAEDGTCRPMEPIDEVPAMQHPLEDVGVILEIPAVRYLTGQSLWNKKFKHAAKMAHKDRERNLKNAKGKDRSRLIAYWSKKFKSQESSDADAQQGGSRPGSRHGSDGSADADDAEGWETDEAPGEVVGAEAGQQGGLNGRQAASNNILDKDWSWTWALDGEAPPPSAIVSRRDFVSVSSPSFCARELRHE